MLLAAKEPEKHPIEATISALHAAAKWISALELLLKAPGLRLAANLAPSLAVVCRRVEVTYNAALSALDSSRWARSLSLLLGGELSPAST